MTLDAEPRRDLRQRQDGPRLHRPGDGTLTPGFAKR